MSKKTSKTTGKDRLSWWREARFGMMITWGIYAKIEDGEWVQYKRRIPIKEYEKLAPQFNPVKFDARAWVRCAKETGMKYVVAMAKHHDGFAMFPSKVSPYNLFDATPWKHDFLKELGDICREEGLHFGLYYSHVREWHHPHASSMDAHTLTHYGNYGNFWDYPQEEKKNLQIFLDEISLPQLREVLERYHPDILWFDTPSLLRPDQAKAFHSLVREICPDCLINSRIGMTAECDYLSCGDNEIPDLLDTDFETPMAMNEAWGYSTQPGKDYKPAAKYINDLIATASRGGNYLLNVGPDPTGCFPDQAVSRFRVLGEWLSSCGEAIYGTTAVPLRDPSWGRITAKQGENLVYLFVQEWRPEITLRGLDSPVAKCTLLPSRQELPFVRRDFAGLTHDLVLQLPRHAPATVVPVIKIELSEPLRVYAGNTEDEKQTIELKVSRSQIDKNPESRAHIGRSNTIEGWQSDDVRVSWEFTAAFDGSYSIEAELKTDFFGVWDSGYALQIDCDGQRTSTRFELPNGYISKLCSYESKYIPMGSFDLKKGRHKLTVSATDVLANLKAWRGVSLASVRLKRA